ncbi:hypothetical protein LXT21_27985 [Myxococcus sp. K38C18041901]|nr:hypothetical protein [Myxococcus guangdongensis]MCP3062631.1 hypothetical protein [Myxococcus guangdongensis]
MRRTFLWDKPGQSQVCEPHLQRPWQRVGEQYVLRLQVTMDDATPMKETEDVRELSEHLEPIAQRESTSLLSKQRVEARGKPLQDQERKPFIREHPECERLDQIEVLEFEERLGLVVEAGHQFLLEARARARNLHRGMGATLEMARQIDIARSSHIREADNDVVACP